MKVIVGKPVTQTNVFSDLMETVVINPYWNVPKSIVRHEMLPHLNNDPYYLDDRGYEVVDASGEIVSSGDVDWWSYGDNIPFDVRQPPGDDNALGNIKFLFPNKHNIYMHDTPLKSLFGKAVRFESSGCVRVHNVEQLVAWILRDTPGWNYQRIVSMKHTGEQIDVKVSKPVPIYLAYITGWGTPDGQVHFGRDIYGLDGASTTASAY